MRSIGLEDQASERPGFFQTIFGALSDIPREQPIRDNLEAIEGRSHRILRVRRIIESIRPQVEAAIEQGLGHTFFLDHPKPQRLAAWRSKAQNYAVKEAGYAYQAYAQLKLSGIVDEISEMLYAIGTDSGISPRDIAAALWRVIAGLGLSKGEALTKDGASEAAIDFFREHDLLFRTRRLRFMLRSLQQIEETDRCESEVVNRARKAIYEALGGYLDRERPKFYDAEMIDAARSVLSDPATALEKLGNARALKTTDSRGEELLVDALLVLPKPERRAMLFAYLGFPLYDIATLPLLQGEGLDEFDPVKVDRIAPEDAQSIRQGGAEATLKGIEFNNFGAFFSRAYRENDFLWGRLHGAERLIDILVSTVPDHNALPKEEVADLKRQAFRAVLEEERPHLTNIGALFDELEGEIG